jgi:putative nucleotidyltransferase with HDIG domain
MDREVISALVRIVELKDGSTAAHTWRVALYAQALAEAASLPPRDVERIMHAAILHDIGKIDIPEEILTKPGKLTPEEFDVIKTHSTLGYDRLVRMGETDDLVLGLVRSHHERLDGTGYPDGLHDQEVPGPAKYFSVIDAFDAMTSVRPYRSATGPPAARAALDELRARAGSWYDPDAVELLAKLYQSGAIDWILHYCNEPADLVQLVSMPTIDDLSRARSASAR